MANPLNETAGLLLDESDDDDTNEHEDIDLIADPALADDNDDDEPEAKREMSVSQTAPASSDDDDDDEDEMDMADVITLLSVAWRNEKLAPELFAYEEDLVERVKAALEERETQIEDMEDAMAQKGKEATAAQNKIVSASQYWFRKELERIRYILHSYLRVRLWKIQKFTLFILQDEAAWNKLSDAERSFATKYSELGERHFKHCFLRELPSKYQALTDKEMIVRPNLDEFVVLQSTQNDDHILIENGKQHLSLQRGDICVSRYSNFKHLIVGGAVDLI